MLRNDGTITILPDPGRTIHYDPEKPSEYSNCMKVAKSIVISLSSSPNLFPDYDSDSDSSHENTDYISRSKFALLQMYWQSLHLGDKCIKLNRPYHYPPFTLGGPTTLGNFPPQQQHQLSCQWSLQCVYHHWHMLGYVVS